MSPESSVMPAMWAIPISVGAARIRRAARQFKSRAAVSARGSAVVTAGRRASAGLRGGQLGIDGIAPLGHAQRLRQGQNEDAFVSPERALVSSVHPDVAFQTRAAAG
jgi:hypothetical protein